MLVTFKPEATWSLFDLADMRDELSRILGHEVDLVVDGDDGRRLEFVELRRRRWSEQDLAALAGGNILRVLRDADAYAAAAGR